MIAVIRVRGTVGVNVKIAETMEMLRLFKSNHLVLADENQMNMVRKVKDYTTFGTINAETFAKVLEKRGRIVGNKKVSKEVLKKIGVKDFKELAEGVLKGKIKLKETDIKPVFRLSPPKKGHKRGGIKKPFSLGGALGNRGEKINELILSMC